MLFADGIVLCSTRRDHVERQLEECRRPLEERGLKISRRKTEYLGAMNINICRDPVTGRYCKENDPK